MDQKKALEESCKSRCTKPYVEYKVLDEMFSSSNLSSLNNLSIYDLSSLKFGVCYLNYFAAMSDTDS